MQCSEICGPYHGFMPIQIDSLQIFEYLTWLNSMVFWGVFSLQNSKLKYFLTGFKYNPYPDMDSNIINIPFKHILLFIGGLVFYINIKISTSCDNHGNFSIVGQWPIINNCNISLIFDIIIIVYTPIRLIYLVTLLVSISYAVINKNYYKQL